MRHGRGQRRSRQMTSLAHGFGAVGVRKPRCRLCAGNLLSAGIIGGAQSQLWAVTTAGKSIPAVPELLPAPRPEPTQRLILLVRLRRPWTGGVCSVELVDPGLEA